MSSAGPRVIHLNGPPGVGKSTLARRYVADHPGTLLLDVDELRTWVGGWERDFVGTGQPVREVALAMLTAWAGTGHDLVLPQLLGVPAELARFRAAAEAGGAAWVSVMVWADLPEVRRRFAARGGERPVDRAVRDLVEAAGGAPIAASHAALARQVERDRVVVVRTDGVDEDHAYGALLAALAAWA